MTRKFKKLRIDIINDFIYSVLATGIPIFVMQFIMYPIMANYMGTIKYGVVLTVIAGTNVIVAMLGNELSYTRLLRNSHYVKNSQIGDFPYLLILALIIMPFIGYSYLHFFLNQSLQVTIVVVIWAMIKILKVYYATSLRLELDYKNILLYNILTSIGYLIGLVVVKNGILWVYAFMTGEIISLLFVLHKSNFKHDPIIRTEYFNATFKTYIILVFSSLLSNSLQYFDKFLIFPILGAESVSIYTVAAFFGKTISLAVLPFSGVLLSYLASSKIVLNVKSYYKLMVLVIMSSLLFLLIAKYLSFPVINFLYPNIANSAREYILIVNLGIVIGIISSISLVIVLKIAPTFWQIVISVISLIIYLSLGYNWIQIYGIYGFAYTLIIVNTTKLVITSILAHNYLKVG
ncbi:hypothetical protein APT62_03065 [Aerococcus urinaeequi]|uniref:hypothetical protein n=1 Tax=Aerococcus urinaeequi TaxID=51665 RepID=UPI00074482D3|nr:hypothetical protein [Aerococcus urinaeequi]ALZ87497.1 hypothetical protein APT62_03065 [Aerococcus urinaeequi]